MVQCIIRFVRPSSMTSLFGKRTLVKEHETYQQWNLMLKICWKYMWICWRGYLLHKFQYEYSYYNKFSRPHLEYNNFPAIVVNSFIHSSVVLSFLYPYYLELNTWMVNKRWNKLWKRVQSSLGLGNIIFNLWINPVSFIETDRERKWNEVEAKNC